MEIISIGPFIEYYTRVRFRTSEVISLIPEDKIEWTYAPGKFTLGDIIRHIATIERYMYAENMLGRPSAYPGCGIDLAAGYGNTVAFMHKLHLESLAIFNSLSPANLQEKCITPGGVAITKWKWLRAMVEHEVHHRGQMFIYLGILGIKTKPIYGLTSEEVLARSAPKRS